MPTPMDPRKKPSSVKIHVSTGEGMDISWTDGHASHYDFAYLREKCPCAMCNDKREKEQDPTAAAHSVISSPELPMFKPKARAQSAASVGNYAIHITFTDGHGSGIYSYEHLRSICPCAECAQARRSDAG